MKKNIVFLCFVVLSKMGPLWATRAVPLSEKPKTPFLQQKTKANAHVYVQAYPDHIKACDNHCLIWHDGTRMPIRTPNAAKTPDAIRKNPFYACDHPDYLGRLP